MARKIGLVCFALVLILASVLSRGESTTAQTPARHTTIVVSYIEYEWWMLAWEDSELLCRILIDHEGVPTPAEVQTQCGAVLVEIWLNTPPCEAASAPGSDASSCDGVYLHLIAYQPTERQVPVELPVPTVYVNLEGCTPSPPENLCPTIPSLLLTGEEPLPNEQIVAIHGTFDGQAFSCPGSICKIQLQPTPQEGILVEFWAESSFGDFSETYTAQVRVIDTGVSTTPGGGGWYVDVVSTQWIGAPLATCTRIWQALPPTGGPPEWLSTPDEPELLASGDPYFYLGGRLIAQGLVDVSECVSGGLQPNGYADTCGLEKSKGMILPWQNQFDQGIIDVAKQTGIPAQLMKNLFAQESQFWPGVFRVPYEYGLGQITDMGADSLLFWNESFYEQFCPLVLTEETCATDYMNLNEENQALLRGALAMQADSSCATCPAGIDLSHAEFSINLFAQTLQANCSQVNQTIYTATQKSAGSAANYEDLWRFTIANYHAGAGCVSFAIHQAWQNTGELTWENVSARFTEACKGAVPYVDKISGR